MEKEKSDKDSVSEFNERMQERYKKPFLVRIPADRVMVDSRGNTWACLGDAEEVFETVCEAFGHPNMAVIGEKRT